MATLKSYRKNDSSLQAFNTIKPLVKRIKWTIRGWWMTITYLYVVSAVLFYFSKEHASITAWVFIPHVIIVLVLYFKNNKRNGRLFATLKEFEDVQKLNLLAAPYKSICNFTIIIICLDAFLWPFIWPIKFVFWILYRQFRRRMKKVRHAILSGGIVLVPDEEEIAADPFYSFLMREGLYEASMSVAEKDDAEQVNELAAHEALLNEEIDRMAGEERIMSKYGER